MWRLSIGSRRRHPQKPRYRPRRRLTPHATATIAAPIPMNAARSSQFAGSAPSFICSTTGFAFAGTENFHAPRLASRASLSNSARRAERSSASNRAPRSNCLSTLTPCRNARVEPSRHRSASRPVARATHGRRHVSARRPSRVPCASPRPLAPHPTNIVSRCSKTRTCEAATAAKPPANSAPSSIQPRAHPAPTAPTESPAPKDRPRRSSLLHGHRTAQVVCSTPAATILLRRVLRYYRRCAMQCPHHSSRLCPAHRSHPRPDHQPCPPPSPCESHPRHRAAPAEFRAEFRAGRRGLELVEKNRAC